jgi:o-succinylbenzoate---CoA ligase
LAAARETPTAAAIVLESGDVISYADLAHRVRRTMRQLVDAGAGSGGVAFVAHLRVETVIVFLAAVELGVPAIPLHPRLTSAERAALVAMMKPDVVLDESWREEQVDPASDVVDAPTRDPEAPLAILFTSGTSGTPKGVAISRRAFLASATASAENLGWLDDDRWLLSMPLAHVGGLSVIVRCVIARRAIVLVPWAGDVGALLDAVRRCRVTLISFVPTLLRKVLDATPDPAFPDHVRAILLGGDASPARLLEDCASRGVPALTTYGMTETCAQIATMSPGERPSPAAGVGRPLPGIEIRIRDGEIQVRSPTTMTGYLPTDRWPSPFLEDGWFPTGDLGEIDAQGRLHVRGRRSALIITGGENVDPLDVERALLTCAAVKEACVFGVPDDHWGQIVAAAIVPVDAATFDREEVERVIEEKLAKFKRPRTLAVVASLATNATGKTDRAATAAAARSSLVPIARR